MAGLPFWGCNAFAGLPLLSWVRVCLLFRGLGPLLLSGGAAPPALPASIRLSIEGLALLVGLAVRVGELDEKAGLSTMRLPADQGCMENALPY
jgi:hypothetical protein